MHARKGIEIYSVGEKVHYFRCSNGNFYAKKTLAMSNVLNALPKRDEVLVTHDQ